MAAALRVKRRISGYWKSLAKCMSTGIWGMKPREKTGSIPTDLLKEVRPMRPIALTSSMITSATSGSFPFLSSVLKIDTKIVLREADFVMSWLASSTFELVRISESTRSAAIRRFKFSVTLRSF